jgi:hypothetical protein
VVLTATDSTQYAWEGDEVIGEAENSVYTHYLVQGLGTATVFNVKSVECPGSRFVDA